MLPPMRVSVLSGLRRESEAEQLEVQPPSAELRLCADVEHLAWRCSAREWPAPSAVLCDGRGG
eukprot:4729547-Pleurochrysis_carterae.AAC.1